MTLRQLVSQTRRGTAGVFIRFCRHADERALREGLHAAPYSVRVCSGFEGFWRHLIYDLGIPRDIC
jgi:hypothetical protein